MPTIQTILQLAEAAAAEITHSRKSWTAFLTTAARLYKYPYPKQLMIPNAMTCASNELWNKRIGSVAHAG